jgi:chorismate-pyruvate lyase
MANSKEAQQFASVNSTNLGLLTRIFLASDGTLTRLLEAAFSESIKPHVHSQNEKQTDSVVELLDL